MYELYQSLDTPKSPNMIWVLKIAKYGYRCGKCSVRYLYQYLYVKFSKILLPYRLEYTGTKNAKK
ncbi:hypothetical protein Hanom_Chr13g01233041 [Helianthus anomalus]